MTYEHLISIPTENVVLEGNLIIPQAPLGIVLFAHGSGSSRFSPRNQFVANLLRKRSLATLLIDLLTAEEEKIDLQTRELRFDIDLLAKRLKGVSDWLTKNQDTKMLNIGYFGSSTGAAAALIASTLSSNIGAVVSRGGRPDLAMNYLPRVSAPTLLIVGGDDFGVIELNEEAFDALKCTKRLEIVPGATHLFEEEGALEKVSEIAGEWFVKHLGESDS